MKAGRLVPDLFLSFKKALYEVKTSGLYLNSIFRGSRPLTYNKKKLYETSDCWSRDMFNFEKGSVTSFSTTSCA